MVVRDVVFVSRRKVYICVVLFPVEAIDSLDAPLAAGSADLTHVAGERYAEHFDLQAGELLENVTHNKLLCERVRGASRQRHVVELRAFACKDVIVANVAIVGLLEGDDQATAGHIGWALCLIVSSVQRKSL